MTGGLFLRDTPNNLFPKCVSSLFHHVGSSERLLTDADRDEERDICEHLPQDIPEVPFTAAVAVLHQVSAPQNYRGQKQQFKMTSRACIVQSIQRNKISQRYKTQVW